MNGIERIAAERKRQITEEGWTSKHDDLHSENELARAAACYALAVEGDIKAPENWPWKAWSWKPSTRIRMLEKAGALIAAEIDRLLRL